MAPTPCFAGYGSIAQSSGTISGALAAGDTYATSHQDFNYYPPRLGAGLRVGVSYACRVTAEAIRTGTKTAQGCPPGLLAGVILVGDAAPGESGPAGVGCGLGTGLVGAAEFGAKLRGRVAGARGAGACAGAPTAGAKWGATSEVLSVLTGLLGAKV